MISLIVFGDWTMIGRLCGLVAGLSLILLACIVWRPVLLHLAWDLGGTEPYRAALSGLLAVCGGTVAICALLPTPRVRLREPPIITEPSVSAPVIGVAAPAAPVVPLPSLHANARLIASSVAAAEVAASANFQLSAATGMAEGASR